MRREVVEAIHANNTPVNVKARLSNDSWRAITLLFDDEPPGIAYVTGSVVMNNATTDKRLSPRITMFANQCLNCE